VKHNKGKYENKNKEKKKTKAYQPKIIKVQWHINSKYTRDMGMESGGIPKMEPRTANHGSQVSRGEGPTHCCGDERGREHPVVAGLEPEARKERSEMPIAASLLFKPRG
jgi:hypothetical protein